VPFRATFSCLWCGRPHATRGPDDLEGWAHLCPDCLGSAGDNEFRRMRLRAGLAERAAASRPAASQPAIEDDPDAGLRAYYAARAAEYDDWYLRRGRFSHGAIDDMAWQADLDAATLWLDGLPLRGEIVELAAGTGWWSPLLAGKGELWCYDAVEAPLERARSRLLAHGLRAHLHVRDAWAEPDRTVDALFCGFWLSHVPRARLSESLALARRWLKPGGRFSFIDSRRDRSSGAAGNTWDPVSETTTRRLDDGREFRVPKVYYEPAELEAALLAAGFAGATVTTTARFFLLGEAVAGE
jgi:demethylmenaquinone methyltransferase/2-methoxy-6-polyprenyl-1,4-benzoquinol methylase